MTYERAIELISSEIKRHEALAKYNDKDMAKYHIEVAKALEMVINKCELLQEAERWMIAFQAGVGDVNALCKETLDYKKRAEVAEAENVALKTEKVNGSGVMTNFEKWKQTLTVDEMVELAECYGCECFLQRRFDFCHEPPYDEMRCHDKLILWAENEVE
jgi:hypothetical protein